MISDEAMNERYEEDTIGRDCEGWRGEIRRDKEVMNDILRP